ncbi:tetratricopeptide repeat protein [Paenalcaligenes sp. Me52]|uniref:tetratricopeptide repeat protein n=1 Tax=Paenalcaligenes sp. Me52 TaxID=3392038 RepID=UPI003D2D1BD7
MSKTMVKLAASMAFITALATTAQAQEADYTAQQVQEMRQLAEQGESFAQAALGVLYIEGNSVPQNYAEAHKWLGRAAAQNEALAQFQLGVLHYRGQGVPQNDAEALAWFGKACAAGLSEGCSIYSQLKIN